ncbi:MAG TPA: acyloxyacyl hydrolase [Pedobacter sp.]|nr:acyloxyacyl hydrolase [Pedobacter sp.]
MLWANQIIDFKPDPMSSCILSSALQVILTLIYTTINGQETKNEVEFNRLMPFHVFSDRSNKISGHATGKYMVYNIGLLNNLRLNSIAFVFDYKDLTRVKSAESINKNQFGNAYTLIGALNFSLVNIKRLKVIFSPGLGFSYLDETWYTNKNPIIQSHLNFASLVALKMSYELSENTKILTGLSTLHFSNAAIRIPNSGMNMFGLSLGLAKHFKANLNKPLKLFINKELMVHKHNFEFGLNIGSRGVYERKKSLYKSGVYVGYNYRFDPLLELSTGIDGVYYYVPFNLKRYVATYQSKATSFDRWRIGIGAGPTVNLGRLSFSALYGYYLHYQSYIPIYTYWNTSIKVKFNSWLAGQAKLYGHQEEVDFLGVGCVFNWTP